MAVFRPSVATDFDPYLGAMGQGVIVSEETQTYPHSHPEEIVSSPGPVVSFHTEFPKPGRYKVWGQFKHGGEIIVADFIVEAENPVLPRWPAQALLND